MVVRLPFFRLSDFFMGLTNLKVWHIFHLVWCNQWVFYIVLRGIQTDLLPDELDCLGLPRVPLDWCRLQLSVFDVSNDSLDLRVHNGQSVEKIEPICATSINLVLSAPHIIHIYGALLPSFNNSWHNPWSYTRQYKHAVVRGHRGPSVHALSAAILGANAEGYLWPLWTHWWKLHATWHSCKLDGRVLLPSKILHRLHPCLIKGHDLRWLYCTRHLLFLLLGLCYRWHHRWRIVPWKVGDISFQRSLPGSNIDCPVILIPTCCRIKARLVIIDTSKDFKLIVFCKLFKLLFVLNFREIIFKHCLRTRQILIKLKILLEIVDIL